MLCSRGSMQTCRQAAMCIVNRCAVGDRTPAAHLLCLGRAAGSFDTTAGGARSPWSCI